MPFDIHSIAHCIINVRVMKFMIFEYIGQHGNFSKALKFILIRHSKYSLSVGKCTIQKDIWILFFLNYYLHPAVVLVFFLCTVDTIFTSIAWLSLSSAFDRNFISPHSFRNKIVFSFLST